jgi:hypothetical protein
MGGEGARSKLDQCKICRLCLEFYIGKAWGGGGAPIDLVDSHCLSRANGKLLLLLARLKDVTCTEIRQIGRSTSVKDNISL